MPLTNVRLASVTSSNPAVRVASALPQLVGSLAAGATAPVAFKFYLGRDGYVVGVRRRADVHRDRHVGSVGTDRADVLAHRASDRRSRAR